MRPAAIRHLAEHTSARSCLYWSSLALGSEQQGLEAGHSTPEPIARVSSATGIVHWVHCLC